MKKTAIGSILLIGALAAIAFAEPEPASEPPNGKVLPAMLALYWRDILSHAIGEPAGRKGRYTAVEFGDFECPSCAKTRATIDKLVSQNGDVTEPDHRSSTEVSLYFVSRPFPTIHVHSIEAAQAAMAAAKRHRFWPMRKALYAHYDRLTASAYAAIAQSAGLRGRAIQAEVAQGDYATDVVASEKLCDRLGIDETPTLAVRDNRTGHVAVAMGGNDIAKFVAGFPKTETSK